MRSVQVLACALALAVVSVSSAPASAQAAVDPTAASIKGVYETVKGYITKAAAQVPEDKYKFQATKDVRTMAQLFGHIANANGLICNTAGGMKAAAAADAEKLTAKADLQKALAASFATCDHAFMMINRSNANEPVTLFGQAHSRLGGMAFNNAHLFEHYGNIVTYMRLNGMVPPSSAGGGN